MIYNRYIFKTTLSFFFFSLIFLIYGCKSAEEKLKDIPIYEKNADKKSIEKLLKYLTDKNENVREQAAYALGTRTVCREPGHTEPTKIGTKNLPRVRKKLLRTLKDPSTRVRLAAIYSLTVYRNQGMVEAMNIALSDKTGREIHNSQIK